MATLSFGFSTPEDIYAKLLRDGAKFTASPDPDIVFNFFVTAVALNDWIAKIFPSHELVTSSSRAAKKERWEFLDEQCKLWVVGRHCIPNPDCDVRRHILNAMLICRRAAGASKHFHWQDGLTAIEPKPIVRGFYHYCTTSVRPDLYFEFKGEVYGLSQVRDILDQYYGKLLAILKPNLPHDGHAT